MCPKAVTKDLFLQRTKKIHGNTYDYSKIHYVNMRNKIDIVCKVHGVFQQTPEHHTYRKQGCPQCGTLKAAKKLLGTKHISPALLKIYAMPDSAIKFKALFSYDKLTGILLNKRTNKTATANNKGYLVIHINRKIYRVHRIIWEMVTGSAPKNVIDHINHNKQDNRWKNLRDVTQEENSRNRSIPSNNKTGVIGVTVNYIPQYTATITIEGQSKELGRFSSLTEATEVITNARKQSGKFHQNHGIKAKT